MGLAINIIIVLILIPWPGIIIMSPMMVASHGFGTSQGSILGALLLINYPILLFGMLKLSGYRFFGMDPMFWLLGFLLVSVSVSFAYGLPRMLLNLNRGIPNNGLHITDRHVYLDGMKIKGADPTSFIVFDEADFRYTKDNNQVYFHGRKMKDADAATFEPVTDEHLFLWKDSRKVYFMGKPIAYADGGSYTYLGTFFGKDRERVFYENRIVKGADPESFTALEDHIGKDNYRLYVMTTPSNLVEDINSFQLFRMEDQLFGKEKDKVFAIFYSQHEPLAPFPDVDIETFEVLDEYYAKDKNKVFYYSYHSARILILENADPNTFEVIYNGNHGSDAQDAERFYRNGELVPLN